MKKNCVTSLARHIAVAVILVPAVAVAESTRYFDLEGFGAFLDGHPETTAISEAGTIELPLQVRDWFADDLAAYSAAAVDPKGRLILARVSDNKLLAVSSNGAVEELYEAAGKLVTAIWVDKDGILIATGPEAQLYRVKEGKAELYSSVEARFVWNIIREPSGDHLLMTGQPAQVLRLNRKKEVEILFEPKQEHLRAAALDPKLGLFVGGASRGILYRSEDLKTFRALYDTGHPEVTGIEVADPVVYVSGVTGAQALVANTTNGKAPAQNLSVRSQIARVDMFGNAQILAGSNDEAVFALGADARGMILIATGATGREDPRGRLYAIEPEERTISLIHQGASRRISHLVPLRNGSFVMVSASGGRVSEIGRELRRAGVFETLPFDTQLNSEFGAVTVEGEIPQGTRVEVSLRSGRTKSPDDSWSDWSKPVRVPGGRPLVSPGRYLQARMTLRRSEKSKSPKVYRLRVAYRRQNLPPFVRNVVALDKGIALLPVVQEPVKPGTLNLKDNGKADGKKGPTPAPRAKLVPRPGALSIRWNADDPNGDELHYDVEVHSAADNKWRVLESDIEQPFLTLDSAQLPDGRYRFKVTATDASSNPVGEGLIDDRISRSILVDNQAPVVDRLRVSRKGSVTILRIAVADAVGPLVAADLSLDNKPFRPLRPDDSVLDGAGENFTVRLRDLPPGEHVASVRVRDEAGNIGTEAVRFEVKR